MDLRAGPPARAATRRALPGPAPGARLPSDGGRPPAGRYPGPERLAGGGLRSRLPDARRARRPPQRARGHRVARLDLRPPAPDRPGDRWPRYAAAGARPARPRHRAAAPAPVAARPRRRRRRAHRGSPRRPRPRRGGPAARRTAPLQPARTVHGDVHQRQHRPAQGHRLLAVQHREQALRARGGPAAGGRGREAALLLAAVPHLRPLSRASGHALLGRHLRLRGQPVRRDPLEPVAARAPHRADQRPPALATDPRPRLRRRGRGRRRRRRAAGDHRRPAAAGVCPQQATSKRRPSASSRPAASNCAAASA